MEIIRTIIFWDLLTYVLLGGMVTIIGSDGKPTQVSASSLQLPKNLNALPGLGNAASISGIYFVLDNYELKYSFSSVVNRFIKGSYDRLSFSMKITRRVLWITRKTTFDINQNTSSQIRKQMWYQIHTKTKSWWSKLFDLVFIFRSSWQRWILACLRFHGICMTFGVSHYIL